MWGHFRTEKGIGAVLLVLKRALGTVLVLKKDLCGGHFMAKKGIGAIFVNIVGLKRLCGAILGLQMARCFLCTF